MKVTSHMSTPDKLENDKPEIMSLHAEERVPLDSQEGTNGGQAALIYQTDSQAGTYTHKYLHSQEKVPLDSQEGTNGGQAALQCQLDSQAGTSIHTLTKTRQNSLHGNNHLDTTPKITGVDIPPKRLFYDHTDELTEEVIVVPTDIDLEILLINSCKINATKVQTIVNNFIEDKKYTTMFCMTETKVDSHDFQPNGITIFSAHRTKKEIKDKKKGED